MSENKLILTADDYGACAYINKGIEIALEKNCINSVATMVTYGDFSRDSVTRLIQLKDEYPNPFKIGLHFSITAGNPIIQKPSTLSKFNQGNSKYWFNLADGFRFNKVNEQDLRNELEAQIETLAEWLGGTDQIDSVSNHHGVVYVDESLFAIYVDVVSKYKIPIRSPLSWLKSEINEEKILLAPVVFEGLNLGFMKKLGEITRKKLVDRQKLADKNGLRMPYCLTDVIYGRPSVNLLQDLMAINENYKVITEFMFHLGDPDTDPQNILAPHGVNHKYFKRRQSELNDLISSEFNLEGLIKQYDVETITFRDLGVDDWKFSGKR